MRGTGPFKIVRIGDPAIASKDTEDYGQYCITRDFSLLKFVDGAKPEIFHARPLTPAEVREVANKIGERDQDEAAFVRGLVKVENLAREDGSQSDWTRPDDRSGKEKPIPDSVIERFFDEAMIREIGSVIRYRSFLGRTRGHYYPLLPISLHVQEARGNALRVEAMRSSPGSAKPSTPAKEPPEAPTAQASEPVGVASTDATATV